MIYLNQVSKSFAKRQLVDAASLHVRPGEKLGLVGINGSGKSTILHLIVGLDEPDSGTVSLKKGARIGYLPQEVLSFSGSSLLKFIMEAEHALTEVRQALKATELAFEEAEGEGEMVELAERQADIFHDLERLGGFDLEARARKLAAGLGFKAEDMDRPVEALSGGWMMRAALARLLLAAPDVLLLDEPTNHLDLDSLVWLEDYLRSSKAAVLLVSHDRTFLDRLVTRIVEVEAGRLTSYPGNYEHYVEEKERRDREVWAAWEAQQERVEQVKRFIERNRVRKDRARQVQARLRMLEKMELIEPPARNRVLRFDFPPPTRSGEMVLELTGLSKGYEGRRLYSGLTLRMRRGERLALLGANGSGKTTLLKLIAGRIEPDGGQLRYGANVRVGYFAQDQVGELDGTRTLLEEMASVAGPDVTQGQLRTLLGAFLFGGEEALKKVSVLSGGERSRLALCKLLLSSPNLLLLDEPTNHLDIESRDVLERALEAYTGTLIIATHDRRLMNRLATAVLSFGIGEPCLYAGNYDDWCRLNAGEVEAAAAPQPEARKKPRPDRDLKVLEAQWRQQRHRRTAPLRARVEDVLARIEEAERELAEIEAELALPETYTDLARARGLDIRRLELKNSLERSLVPEWERASEELEELEREMGETRPSNNGA
jgi:ATP-binding cassette subfamily F protein 3